MYYTKCIKFNDNGGMMNNSLFLFNSATLGIGDIKMILELAGFTEYDDFDSIIKAALPEVQEFLKLVKSYYKMNFERKASMIEFEHHESNLVSNIKHETGVIKFVYDKINQAWSVVTTTNDGTRFEKRIDQISEQDTKEYCFSLV